ncbi:amidohydrolase [Allopusillimonas soli]|uniref:Amidohydrolase family protein n=1 Tax=Allopusillimonas soli TaxID=659016 RepID=A0A853FGN9_9BURK|nr:amidohydrolase family protein [Allopusillimonas soli]NYT37960.1 amidohydrolase family protein [Allopusillimonas soli]TEA73857.1 amidohydrolase [Allopusillimonas soli]
MALSDNPYINSLPGEEIGDLNASKGWSPPAPATSRDRGTGPYKRLVLRGATIIDGTGAPPWGPADIVVEQDRIVATIGVGASLATINPKHRPAPGDHEIDCHGKFVLPGLVDSHAHIGTPYHSMCGDPPPADYIYKLWLAHGVTTVREMGGLNGLQFTLQQRDASARQEIAAPHIVAHAYFPAVNERVKTIYTPDQAREWVRKLKERGADGIKFFGAPPSIMKAALDEAAKLGLRSGCHHAQMAVTRVNALKSASWGLTSTEHYYGLPEALFEDQIVQDYPTDYNYFDEYFRFSLAGQMFLQAAQPGTSKWNDVLDQFLELGHTFVPTFNIYDANRDLMRARRADWHDAYTWRAIWKYFQPQRGGHGAYWYRWSTRNEVEWKQNYRLWMQFVNDYKNRGGRVCTGSDSGFIFQIFGFGLIRELELLQEAGFHPLEVMRAATSQGAELLGVGDETGSVEAGKRADLLVLDENPLDDFKLLYGTGAMRLNDDTGKVEWHRALRWTIKAGMVLDVDELLADVRTLVDQSWEGDPERPPNVR